MELYDGRPDSTEGRLPREIRTYDFLDSLGIEYKRTDHEPANNMEACNEIDAVLVNTLRPDIAIPVHYGSIVGKPSDGDVFAENVKNPVKVVIKIQF